MRKIVQTALLLLPILVFQYVVAQDYNPLPRGLTQLYSFELNNNPDKWFFAARADSVVAEGVDSAHYLYRIATESLPSDTMRDCFGVPLSQRAEGFRLSQDHYLGQKMLRSPSGVCRFVSSVGDTFRIESQGNVGAIWNFNDTITASIDSILFRPILGQSDSIKFINLSDGRQIQLSKNYGFAHVFPFLPFVLNGAQIDPEFTIWGIPQLNVGGHFPSRKEIFDFENGDHIQMVRNRDAANNFHWLTLRSTAYGQDIPAPFLVNYMVNTEELEILSSPFPPFIDSTYTNLGTNMISIDTSIYPELTWLPYETSEPGRLEVQRGIHSRQIYNDRIQFNFQQVDWNDTCSNSLITIKKLVQRQFTVGLGRSYYYEIEHSSRITEQIGCYEKAFENYGTCEELGTLIGIEEALDNRVELYPNPADLRLYLSLEAEMLDANLMVSIHALDGRKLYEEEMFSAKNRLEISTADLPQGIYLLQIEKDGYQPFSQRFVVQR